jgi:hypothetical protein
MSVEFGQTILSHIIRAAQYQREEFVRCARAGDWAPLQKHIRRGGRITSQMRSFLADVLSGKEARPHVKISKLATKKRNSEFVRFIREARERGEKEAKYSMAAEKKFGRTWRHLQKILAEGDPSEETPYSHAGSLDNAEAELQTAHLTPTGGVVWHPGGVIPRHKIRPDGSVIRYRLSDMALSPHTLT